MFDIDRPEVLIIVGSSHATGKSALYSHALAKAFRIHGIKPHVWHLVERPIAGCDNCGVCATTGKCRIEDDGWGRLSSLMETVDLAYVIAPVYFAGPSSALKAMLDRCQMFWARKYLLERDVPAKRPAHLIVIGDGGDPFGSEPLETICISALNCANLRIAGNIHRMIGDEAFDLTQAGHLADIGLVQIGWMGKEEAR